MFGYITYKLRNKGNLKGLPSQKSKRQINYE